MGPSKMLPSTKMSALGPTYKMSALGPTYKMSLDPTYKMLQMLSLGPTSKDAADGLVGPNEDAGAGSIDLTTPKPFVDQPHFIRSNNPRSSTGYKGIVKDKRGGWRDKWSGKHIDRYDTKMQACQAYEPYYDYCVEKGYIGPR